MVVGLTFLAFVVHTAFMPAHDRLFPSMILVSLPLLLPVVVITLVTQAVLWVPDGLAAGMRNTSTGPGPLGTEWLRRVGRKR